MPTSSSTSTRTSTRTPNQHRPQRRRGFFRAGRRLLLSLASVAAAVIALLLLVHSLIHDDSNSWPKSPSLQSFPSVQFRRHISTSSRHHAVTDAAVVNHRFPPFGTPENSELCGWALPPSHAASTRTTTTTRIPTSTTGKTETGWGCTILIQQEANGNEGIGHWASELTAGFLYHVQTGHRCRLLVDYADSVDLTELLMPVSRTAEGGERQRDDAGVVQHEQDASVVIDWRTPPNFNCTAEPHCVRVNAYWKSRADIAQMVETLGLVPSLASADSDYRETRGLVQMVPVPEFRHVWSSTDKPYATLSAGIGGGFRPKEAMACAFSHLFRLAPTFGRYRNNVFSELLPAVRDPKALVIALYVRTGRTDAMAKVEAAERGWGGGREFGLQIEIRDKKGLHKVGPDRRRRLQEKNGNKEALISTIGPIGEGVVKCALQAEEELLLSSPPNKYERIVWTVLGDDPDVIGAISSRWNKTMGGEENSQGGIITHRLPRRILGTSSAGTHVRPRRRPTTGDFAEAMMDWFLLGESDAMATVTRQFSFGETALLRNGARARIYAPASKVGDECIQRKWK